MAYRLLKILSNSIFLTVLIFIIFSILRIIPESSIGQYPTGFDTINAYPLYFTSKITFLDSIRHFDLFHFLVYSVNDKFSIGSIWTTLKVWGVVLYGGLVASFFAYLVYGQRLKKGQALVISMIFGLSLSTLRISMELFRNELGLILMFIGLIFWENITLKIKPGNIFNLFLFIIFGLLVYGAHELTTILLFLVIGSKITAYSLSRRNFYWQAVVFLLFFLILILTPIIIEDIAWLKMKLWTNFLITNTTQTIHFSAVPNLVAGFFLFLYGALLPWAILGLIIKRINYFAILLLLLTYISISPIIYSGYGFYIWDRWMYLIIIPLSYLSYFGLEYISLKSEQLWKASGSILLSVCLVFILWKPIAFLCSGGENSPISAIKLPDSRLSDIFPSSLADNSLHQFNKSINNDFIARFNKLNKENIPAVIDRSFSGYVILGGIKAPLIEAFYGKLPPSRQLELALRNYPFYTINDTYGLKNWTGTKTIGTITVYKFEKIENKELKKK